MLRTGKQGLVLCCCALLFSILLFSGCITPPPPSDPVVLPVEEVRLVTLMSRAEALSRGGRVNLAEEYLRHAYVLAPKLPNVANNLGYVLLEQNRNIEAELYFRQAIELDPNNIPARNNLIRSLYQQRNFESAIVELHWFLGLPLHNEVSGTGSFGPGLSPVQQAVVFRDIAVASYAIGRLQDARCYSERAVQLFGNPAQVLQHARLLMSIENVDNARSYLKNIVVNANAKSSSSLVEYALMLYLTDDFALASQAVARIMSLKSSRLVDKFVALALNLLIAMHQKENERLPLIEEAFFEMFPEFCEKGSPKTPVYWPEQYIEQIEVVKKLVCNETS